MRVTLNQALQGQLAPVVESLSAAQVASRIAAKDHLLWGDEASSEASIRLGWVDSAIDSVDLVAEIYQLRNELRANGVDRIVLCGMGGSSLAPEVICKNSAAELVVLDSTSPDQVAAAVRELDRTAVVVSSKSGSTVETDSQKRAFESAFEQAGISPASRIIVVTDPGSPLDQAARSDGYRVFNADANVGGRYSALTAFGLVPSGLAGADIAALLHSAQLAKAELSADSAENPALLLAAAVGATPSAFGGHRDKFLIETDRLPGFGDWAEQLVAESTGKLGRGSLPVVVSAQAPELAMSLPDSVSVRFGSAGSAADVSFEGELGELFLLWEYATAALGWLLEINPFDQPDVESAKVAARALLDAPSAQLALDFVADGISVAGHGLKLQGRSLAAALDHLLSALAPNGYLSIHAYANRQEFAGLERLRDAFAERLGRPVTFGWGPRFLHSTGQYHKGGPAQGVFLQLAVASDFDLAVPGRPFSFGGLIQAQMAGDANVLAERGLPVLTLTLSDPIADIEKLVGLARNG